MNLSELKKLIRLFENSEISDLEVDQEGVRVRMKKKRVMQVSSAAGQEVARVAPPQIKSAETKPAAASGGHIIKAPMVGTFYGTSSPSGPAFVEEGAIVRKGQVLCIIEAMKLMNEIESEVGGKIVKIFPENGKPVEFGEPLFEVQVS